LAWDPYDLALTKLERNIERDYNDVLHMPGTILVERELLRERNVTELCEYLGNPVSVRRDYLLI
jgi:hypothetical protein